MYIHSYFILSTVFQCTATIIVNVGASLQFYMYTYTYTYVVSQCNRATDMVVLLARVISSP